MGSKPLDGFRKVAPKSKILFLSQEIDVDVAHVALTYGHGYVVKSDVNNELFAAIEVVMQGEKFVSLRLAADCFAVIRLSGTATEIRYLAFAESMSSPRSMRGI